MTPAIGQRYTLDFFLPASNGRGVPITVHGQVTNIVLTNRGFRLGIGFIGADAKTREVLERFVNG